LTGDFPLRIFAGEPFGFKVRTQDAVDKQRRVAAEQRFAPALDTKPSSDLKEEHFIYFKGER